MSKKSVLEREKKRRAQVVKYAAKREELKKIILSPSTPKDRMYEAQDQLNRLPRNSSRVRLKSRCFVTGRPRAYIGRFGLSRLTFREFALAGRLSGVFKVSW